MALLSRQEVADRLIALGNALAESSEIELSSGGDTLKIGVAGQLNWELEIEIDGDETELEIELKWTDDPPSNERDAGPDAVTDSESHSDKPGSARRGHPRKAAAT